MGIRNNSMLNTDTVKGKSTPASKAWQQVLLPSCTNCCRSSTFHMSMYSASQLADMLRSI